MALDFLKDRSIKYLNRDFDGFKRDLMKFADAHHSGVLQDFNEASPTMAILEMQAYVGAVLSFYQDRQFDELRQETARQLENVVAFAKQKGYRPKGKSAAIGTETFFVEVPATTLSDGSVVPNNIYAPVMKKGARIVGSEGVPFETLADIDFSSSLGRFVTGSRFDQNTGLPTYFALRNSVEIVAGETKTTTFVVTDFEQFKTLEIPDEDVLEVIDCIDSDNNEWFEVDFLAQDTVLDESVNVDADSSVVPYTLKLKAAPRRFITDRDPITKKTSMIFGSGDGINFDDELVPNLADLALPLAGRRTFTSFALDPQNFLKTRSLGLSPFNTTLTVRYRVGGGTKTNQPPGAIKTVVEATLEFSSTSLTPSIKGTVVNSLECINYEPTKGGGPEESISEIKANSDAYFAAQERVVTREDAITRVFSLPERFGKPDKVYVKRNPKSALSLDIHILSRDSDGLLTTASSTLKSNIRTYLSRYRMLTDGYNLLDGSIINLRCNFGIVTSPRFNRTEVLTKCLALLRDELSTDRMQINRSIIISELFAKLQGVTGVVSVYQLKFSNLVGLVDGLTYSPTAFDVESNTVNNIVYCPTNAIFEIKHPNRDIVGVSR